MTHRNLSESAVRTAHSAVLTWFDAHARDLPWRDPATSAWAVLVSEIMSQQTPVARVAPRWQAWIERWPKPSDLAAAPTAEVLVAWDSLGYPRRALRLKECAQVIADDFADEVPCDEETLRGLPGIGAYTAAAVAAFACHRRTTVLDVNIRRVLARVFDGHAHPKGALSRKETAWASRFVPGTAGSAVPEASGSAVPEVSGGAVPEAAGGIRAAPAHVRWNAGLMELGALVCTSRNPRCEQCPLSSQCAWLAAGRPEPSEPARRPKTQAWEGTDRQLRGAIMSVLKTAGPGLPVPLELLTASATEEDPAATAAYLDAATRHLGSQRAAEVEAALTRVRELGTGERIGRLSDALIADGLAAATAGRLHLPH